MAKKAKRNKKKSNGGCPQWPHPGPAINRPNPVVSRQGFKGFTTPNLR
jgi:hypothetical protein